MRNKPIFKILIFLLFFSVSIFVISNNLIFNASTSGSGDKHFTGYSYNMDGNLLHEITRLPSYSTDAPSITFLVHGLGGNASDWSNDNQDDLFYDSTSLIEKLRDKNETMFSGKNVYWAKFAQNNKFTLFELIKGTYYVGYNNENLIRKLDDVSKHMIIVCEFYRDDEYHRVVYEQLHTLIDKISYDVLYLTGKIPKVNLISHSRGGLISMMYASGYRESGKIANVNYSKTSEEGYIDLGNGVYEENKTYNQNSTIIKDHPYNVEELYSIGTPYSGTDLSNGVTELVLENLFQVNLGTSAVKNVLDPIIQNEIYSCWEEAVDKNPNLNLTAIYGTCDLNCVVGVIVELIIERINLLDGYDLSRIIDTLQGIKSIMQEVVNTLSNTVNVSTIASVFIPVLNISLLVRTSGLVITINQMQSVIESIDETLNEFTSTYDSDFDSITLLRKQVYEALIIPLNEFINGVDMFEEFIGQFTNQDGTTNNYGDLFIDTNSQKAEGFSNVTSYERFFTYYSYECMINSNGEFSIPNDSKNFEMKKSNNNVGIPHNLETRDSNIIEYICNNIEMDVPSTFYEYTSWSYNTVKLMGINRPSYYYDSDGYIKEEYAKIKPNLPFGLNGKEIAVIGDEAFKNEIYLDSIIIPSTVIEIGDSAFENCSSLTKINIPSSVISIGSHAFKNCTSLTEVKINRDENDITEIGINAFYGCTSLNNINVPSNRIFDYSNASNWKTYKSKITSNVSFEGIDINCYSNSNSTIMINPGEKGILKINVNCPKSYKITASSNNYIIFKLYDSYMRETNIAPTSYDSCSGEINSYLTNGEYYISVEYTHPAIEGYALINIQQTYSNNNSFVYGSNNVLTHLHEINGELKNSSIYSNGYGRGLYKIIINGNLQSYQNVLTIYDDINKVEPMKRIETALYELDAKTTMISNNLVVYLNEGQSYYIDIAVPIGTYDSLTLTIERIEESIEVDLVHYEHENDGDPTNDNIIYEHIIMTDETQIGDHFVMLEILEPSSISVIYDYIGTQEEYIYFVLFKEVYVNNEIKYKMQLVFPDMMVTYGESLEWKSSITAGRHYIGYFNKLNPDSIISISITR